MLNIFIGNDWILKYLYNIKTLQTRADGAHKSSVCPFAKQATASEGRRAVRPGNPNFSSSETAPSPHTFCTGSVPESSEAHVRKWSPASDACGPRWTAA